VERSTGTGALSAVCAAEGASSSAAFATRMARSMRCAIAQPAIFSRRADAPPDEGAEMRKRYALLVLRISGHSGGAESARLIVCSSAESCAQVSRQASRPGKRE
jgi:hypothetical protein